MLLLFSAGLLTDLSPRSYLPTGAVPAVGSGYCCRIARHSLLKLVSYPEKRNKDRKKNESEKYAGCVFCLNWETLEKKIPSIRFLERINGKVLFILLFYFGNSNISFMAVLRISRPVNLPVSSPSFLPFPACS